jgi:hypothetical protein
MASTKDLIQKRSVAQQSDALKQQVNQEYLNTQPQPQPKPQISLAQSAEQIEAPKTISINSPEMDAFREQVIAKNLYGVETPEEKAKRERNDALRVGYTGLVDGLSSLANLYYTTKWAPNSQRQMAMPQLQQDLYRERLERDRKLQNFRQWQQREAAGQAQREHDLKKLKLEQDYNQRVADDKNKREMQKMKIKYMYDLGLVDARKAADLEKQIGKLELDKELESVIQEYRVKLEGIKHNNIVSRNNYNGSNRTIRVPIGNNGEYEEYRKDDLTNDIVIADIYHKLPDEYKVRGKRELNIETGEYEEPIIENPDTGQMGSAIGKALAKGYLQEMAPEIKVGEKKTGAKKSEKKNKEGKVKINWK